MTREEAIKILSTRDAHGVLCGYTSGVTEALDLAIEALNREQKKYDAICSELVALKSDLTKPIEVAIAYENSIAIVKKYAKMGGSE